MIVEGGSGGSGFSGWRARGRRCIVSVRAEDHLICLI